MAFENRYGFLDRVLHKIAFSSWTAQAALSDFENTLFAERLSSIDVKRPVFITALPRAGTTLLLELCNTIDEFTSHSYRNMPFVLTPLLWNRFAQPFHSNDEKRERAHGDGMMVGMDSPEAFEEIVWRTFWRSNYKKGHIETWAGQRDQDFERFLRDHIRKIIALSASNDSLNTRYISKNNLNISRVNYLRKIFSDSITVILYRDPIAHASSLLRQHQNFLKIHAEDKFAKSYMLAIGHYDFGDTLKPVNFSNWLNNTPYKTPNLLSFWLAYWCACYGYLAATACSHALFLSYDRLSANPVEGLTLLAEKIGIDQSELFIEQAGRFRQPRSYETDTEAIPSELLLQVQQVLENITVRSTF